MYLLEMFTRNLSTAAKILVDVHQQSSQQTKEDAETQHNGVSNANAQRGLTPKEGLLSGVPQQGRKIFAAVLHD